MTIRWLNESNVTSIEYTSFRAFPNKRIAWDSASGGSNHGLRRHKHPSPTPRMDANRVATRATMSEEIQLLDSEMDAAVYSALHSGKIVRGCKMPIETDWFSWFHGFGSNSFFYIANMSRKSGVK